ncbi:helix-turn-helix domain-containing protein [Cupriavidus campinensis]
MARPEVITVSMRELDRLKTVQAVVDGQLRPGVAAERLGITDRQFRRLLERYRQEGPSELVTRKRGRPSNNRLSADREAAALGLIREHYADFGPTLACEKLRERHGLTLSKETIRNPAGPLGQGTAPAQYWHHGGRQRLHGGVRR